MHNLKLTAGLILITLIISCSGEKTVKTKIGNPVDTLQLSSEIMTPEVLWSFGRVGSVQLSPDQKTIAFGVSFYNIGQNSGNSEIFTMSAEGDEATNITNTKSGEYSFQWRPDGKKIGFLSTEIGRAHV